MEADKSHMSEIRLKWNLCMICQDVGNTSVVKPTMVGFSKLLDDLQKWRKASIEPSKMNRQRVDYILSIISYHFLHLISLNPKHFGIKIAETNATIST